MDKCFNKFLPIGLMQEIKFCCKHKKFSKSDKLINNASYFKTTTILPKMELHTLCRQHSVLLSVLKYSVLFPSHILCKSSQNNLDSQ